MGARGIVTLLTDFGLADYYVGALKGTLLRLAPGVQLVDLSHEIPPGDVEAAAELLAGAAPTFPAGTVHLAVVDPGVGSGRRMLVVEDGERSHHLVAPDNGLLEPFLAGAAGAAWAVTRRDLFLDGPGATFHGRDRFAPIAAALLRGDHPAALGEPVRDAVRLRRPAPRREELPEGLVLHGRVVRVDRFGNLVTDLPAVWVEGRSRDQRAAGGVAPGTVDGPREQREQREQREGVEGLPSAHDPGRSAAGGGAGVLAEVAGHRATRWVTHYAELPAGEAGVLVGSLGTLELSLRDASLAERWRVSRGAAVRIELRGRGEPS